ncbi:kinase domain protein [Aspergillus campestris IBT 28561]|uniref:non-specific serine/threonine protein kinase n=1 Tax=Aspergillus campestris (strain IBT 28561) TaxID=1392248 RepID=A0A2I1D6L6_ASPC2|nr:kinase domain protein [Aspergillus campestris IBT 28561]PKY05493.1 kinase domain protein [Aspergillus campestris IBT 28561]
MRLPLPYFRTIRHMRLNYTEPPTWHLSQRRTATSLQTSQPHVFPTSGFITLDSSTKFEGGTLPDYMKESFYPVHIGEVFNSRYQVITKLGFGSSSTVWLCRDLRYGLISQNRKLPEVDISNHLRANYDARGVQRYLRLVIDSFEVPGPHGVHPCLLYEPAGVDIRDYIHCLEGDALPENLLRPTLRFVLIALDHLHKARVIHTDVQPNNVLLGIDDESILAEMEEDEISDPAPRKQLCDRTIFATRAMPLTGGEPVLADLGEARFSDGKQTGLIMPSVYRAPEVMLGMTWDNKVGIWALGQMAWTLFEQGHLFKSSYSLENETGSARRFAEMISLLGPPPVEFLARSEGSFKFRDRNGVWKPSQEIPEQSLESRESRLETHGKAIFLRFLRKTLHWVPEERPTAEELLLDEWIRGDDY